MHPAAAIAAYCAAALALSLVASILIGAMASLVPDHPGTEHPITTLGHRAIGWACLIGALTVAVAITLEHMS